jgi:hypothetical protein
MSSQRYMRRPEHDRRAGEFGRLEADAWEDTALTIHGDGWGAMNIVFTKVGQDANKLVAEHVAAKDRQQA